MMLGVALFAVLYGACRADDGAGAPPGEASLCSEHGKLNTSDATPVEPGCVEVELGCTYGRSTRMWDADGVTVEHGLIDELALGASVTVGLAADVDLSFGLDYLWLRDDSGCEPPRGEGVGDIAVSGRWRFLADEGRKLDIAWISGFVIPTGTGACPLELGTSQEFWSWDNALALSKDWGRWTANAELGFSLPIGGDRGDARGCFAANAAAGWHVTPSVQPEIELNYAWDLVSGAPDSRALAATAALIVLLPRDMRVIAGVQETLWGREADRAMVYLLRLKAAF